MDEPKPLNRHRLVVLLEEIKQALSEFIARARSDAGVSDAATAPPGCPVRGDDIATSSLYLQQVGLGIDGGRLRSEYDDLGLRCLRAIMLVDTWNNPAEGPARQHQFGAYVQPVANEAEFKEQQDFLRWSSIGSASTLKATIEGLLKTMGQTNAAPPQPPEVTPAGTESAAKKPSKGGRPQKWAELLDLNDKMKAASESTPDKEIVAAYNKKNPRAGDRATVAKLRDARSHRKQLSDRDNENPAA